MLAHWIWLSTRPGIGCQRAVEILRQFPDVESLYFAGNYEGLEGLEKKHCEALADKSLDEAQQILEQCQRKGIQILTYQDSAYPARLRQIPNPPLVLYYKGTLPEFDSEAAVGVVGTRKVSAYGCLVAKRLGYQITKCGGLVVSGLADGTDTMAMRGALMADGKTVGVLGCGVDVIYPRHNEPLYLDTVNHGCLISEYPPGTPPIGRNFPRRNRIISGLSCGVVVVEAPAKSGALITAQLALDQGRDVFAVPGNIDSFNSAGSNALLRQGAYVVQCGWDIMEEYEAQFPGKVHNTSAEIAPIPYPGEQKEPQELTVKVAQKKRVPKIRKEKTIDNGETTPYSEAYNTMPALEGDEQTVYDSLREEIQHIDQVISKSGLQTARVLAALTMLEVKGLAVRHPGKYYSRPRQ